AVRYSPQRQQQPHPSHPATHFASQASSPASDRDPQLPPTPSQSSHYLHHTYPYPLMTPPFRPNAPAHGDSGRTSLPAGTELPNANHLQPLPPPPSPLGGFYPDYLQHSYPPAMPYPVPYPSAEPGFFAPYFPAAPTLPLPPAVDRFGHDTTSHSATAAAAAAVALALPHPPARYAPASTYTHPGDAGAGTAAWIPPPRESPIAPRGSHGRAIHRFHSEHLPVAAAAADIAASRLAPATAAAAAAATAATANAVPALSVPVSNTVAAPRLTSRLASSGHSASDDDDSSDSARQPASVAHAALSAAGTTAAGANDDAPRESHVQAERRRRREIKALLDSLRRALPPHVFTRDAAADASRPVGRVRKWEVLARAVEHVQMLGDAVRERDRLREELAECRRAMAAATTAVAARSAAPGDAEPSAHGN
ncbi:hypothetical protein HK405_012809, partial [Cladochytrium tenue]